MFTDLYRNSIASGMKFVEILTNFPEESWTGFFFIRDDVYIMLRLPVCVWTCVFMCWASFKEALKVWVTTLEAIFLKIFK